MWSKKKPSAAAARHSSSSHKQLLLLLLINGLVKRSHSLVCIFVAERKYPQFGKYDLFPLPVVETVCGGGERAHFLVKKRTFLLGFNWIYSKVEERNTKRTKSTCILIRYEICCDDNQLGHAKEQRSGGCRGGGCNSIELTPPGAKMGFT